MLLYAYKTCHSVIGVSVTCNVYYVSGTDKKITFSVFFAGLRHDIYLRCVLSVMLDHPITVVLNVFGTGKVLG